MLTIKDLNLDRKLSAGVALYFSSDALPLFEAEFSDDLRPRKAIESAIKWLSNPCKETADTARAAATAAHAAAAAVYAAHASSAAAHAAGYAAHASSAAADAGYAAYYAAAHASYAAADAGYAAGYAAHAAAGYAAHAAASAAHAAAYAAYAAANAFAVADKKKYTHDRIVKILPLILEYKIKNEQSFENAEKVLEYLKDEGKVSFLFNLNILR